MQSKKARSPSRGRFHQRFRARFSRAFFVRTFFSSYILVTYKKRAQKTRAKTLVKSTLDEKKTVVVTKNPKHILPWKWNLNNNISILFLKFKFEILFFTPTKILAKAKIANIFHKKLIIEINQNACFLTFFFYTNTFSASLTYKSGFILWPKRKYSKSNLGFKKDKMRWF